MGCYIPEDGIIQKATGLDFLCTTDSEMGLQEKSSMLQGILICNVAYAEYGILSMDV
jgi:hypothetical protein